MTFTAALAVLILTGCGASKQLAIPAGLNSSYSSSTSAQPTFLFPETPATETGSVAELDAKAKKGNTMAAYALALKYYKGDGVSKDDVQAEGYLSFAMMYAPIESRQMKMTEESGTYFKTHLSAIQEHEAQMLMSSLIKTYPAPPMPSDTEIQKAMQEEAAHPSSIAPSAIHDAVSSYAYCSLWNIQSDDVGCAMLGTDKPTTLPMRLEEPAEVQTFFQKYTAAAWKQFCATTSDDSSNDPDERSDRAFCNTAGALHFLDPQFCLALPADYNLGSSLASKCLMTLAIKKNDASVCDITSVSADECHKRYTHIMNPAAEDPLPKDVQNYAKCHVWEGYGCDGKRTDTAAQMPTEEPTTVQDFFKAHTAAEWLTLCNAMPAHAYNDDFPENDANFCLAAAALHFMDTSFCLQLPPKVHHIDNPSLTASCVRAVAVKKNNESVCDIHSVDGEACYQYFFFRNHPGEPYSNYKPHFSSSSSSSLISSLPAPVILSVPQTVLEQKAYGQDGDAAYTLGMKYFHGDGVTKDLIQAEAWLSITQMTKSFTPPPEITAYFQQHRDAEQTAMNRFTEILSDTTHQGLSPDIVERNQQRKSDLQSVLNVVGNYQAQHNYHLPPTLPATPMEICRVGATDCTGLLPYWDSNDTYYFSLNVVDPSMPSGSKGIGYFIQKNIGGTVTVTAPHAEGGKVISQTN
ncbi:MAG: hypothetical protein JWM56_597 [Candidatus Peribacteria bacterium]|nr:hypothetical protein [Candidatus Peribacteria bacterium]